MSIDLAPERRPLVFAACVAAIFVAAVESTIVATAMPTIASDLGGFSLLGWVFAAYLLTQAVSIPIYGRLADLYGRKKILFIGLGIFIVGCLLCGFAPTMFTLVLARCVQGLGAGAILPVSLTIIGDAYPAHERVKVQPYLASIFAGSSILGPVLGAFIIEYADWPLIFWFNIPIGVVAIIMLATFLKEHPRSVEHTIDIVGAMTLIIAITALLLAMLQADAFGWWTLALIAVSAAFLILFLRVEKRSHEPLLSPILWRNPTLLIANLSSFMVGGAIMGMTAFLPTYLQGVMGYGVSETGLTLIVLSFSWPASSIISARIMLRTSYRTTATIGGLMLVTGALGLALMASAPEIVRMTALSGRWPLAVAVFFGAGMGFTNSSQHLAMQEASGAKSRGAATSGFAFMRMVGSAFGTAVLGGVLNLSLAFHLPDVREPMQTLMEPERYRLLPPDQTHALGLAVGDSLDNVFWAMLVLALVTLIIARRTPAAKPGHLAPTERTASGNYN